MENITGKVIEILLANPLTVTLILAGIILVAIALIGQIPIVQGQYPITGLRAIALGTFGMLLIMTAIGLSVMLASSSAQPQVVLIVTATPLSENNQAPTLVVPSAVVSRPTLTAAPSLSDIATPSPQSSNPTVQGRKELIGLWEYRGNRAPMPSPPEEGQVIMANGDITNSGTCNIRIFQPGEFVEGLGEGTFQLWRITGTTSQIEQIVQEIQLGAAAHANMACPRL
jgi:hypothetical protein